MANQLEERIIKGAAARLFPVLPESKKEERATSVLLSVLTIVPDFSSRILEVCEVKVSPRTVISGYTEVSFKGEHANLRPDGLLIVSNQKSTWTALIESKIGNSAHSDDQVESYLNIAKEQGINAVITISNQYTASPQIHPSYSKKPKHKNISLYHFSWASINAASILLIENKSVSDKEQAFILHELTRFLSHESSGISSTISLPKSWKTICDEVFQGIPIKKTSPETADLVAAWFQLLRYSTISLSLALSRSCIVNLARKHVADNNQRIQDSISLLVSKNLLSGAIQVPDAASNLEIEIDLNKRTLKLSSKIQTPKDVKQTRAAMNFAFGQFKNTDDVSLLIKFNWPGRIAATQGVLIDYLEEEKRPQLVPEGFKGLPVSAEIIRIIDLGAGIKSNKKLNELFNEEVINYYRNSLQIMKNWQPKAPKVKRQTVVSNDEVNIAPVATPIDSQAVKRWPFKLGVFDNN